MNRRTFAVHEDWFTLCPDGTEGAHALACALGFTIVLRVDQVVERGEWLDALAKMRGMAFANVLRTFPVVRQACGCRLVVESEHLLARLCQHHAATAASIPVGVFTARD